MRSRGFTLRLWVLIWALAASCNAAASKEPDERVVVNVTRPTIIGYFPPSAPEEIDPEALEHLRHALEQVRACLGEANVDVRLELTRLLVFRIEGREHRIELPRDEPRDIGAYLARPGS